MEFIFFGKWDPFVRGKTVAAAPLSGAEFQVSSHGYLKKTHIKNTTYQYEEKTSPKGKFGRIYFYDMNMEYSLYDPFSQIKREEKQSPLKGCVSGV